MALRTESRLIPYSCMRLDSDGSGAPAAIWPEPIASRSIPASWRYTGTADSWLIIFLG